MNALLHTRATCLTPGCPWDADGDDTDLHAAQHREARHHQTATSTHPATNCDRMGCHE